MKEDLLPREFLAIGDIHGDLLALKRGLQLADKLTLQPICFGDVVGGEADSECIQCLRDSGCLVIRGNHEQWLVEKPTEAFDCEEIRWMSELKFELSNEEIMLLHTRYSERDDGLVEWRQLQGQVEILDFFQQHRQKYILAGHTHLAAVNIKINESLEYISNLRLRREPEVKIVSGRAFIDVGSASDNLLVFKADEAGAVLRYIFF